MPSVWDNFWHADIENTDEYAVIAVQFEESRQLDVLSYHASLIVNLDHIIK